MPRAHWPAYQTLRPLIHAHVGRPAVICGGGPSLTDGMAQSPADAVYISCNDHGVRFLKRTGDPRRCSYIVAPDKIEQRARVDVGEFGQAPGDGLPWNLPVISRHMWADYRLLFMPGPLSGITAAWVARLMGCAPIICLGMDLHVGPCYFDDPKAHSSSQCLSAKEHTLRWMKACSAYPGMYRMIGGHAYLRERLGVYDPSEPTPAPVTAGQLAYELRAVRVRFMCESVVMMRPFRAGEVLDFNAAEVKKLVAERRAVKVS